MIKNLAPDLIDTITSNQIILDISQVELIENSIDSGSKTIIITMERQGLDKITVSDNGFGIQKESFDVLLQQGATSKIQSMQDISGHKSFGFRGQALYAISNLCDLTIITKTQADSMGSLLKFENNQLKINTQQHENGTIMIVQKIFNAIPVRKDDLKKNIKIYFNKIILLIKEYALINQDIKFILKNDQQQLINSGDEKTIESKIDLLLGPNYSSQVQKFKINKQIYSVEGWILKTINSGSGSNNLFLKQSEFYFYINKKPINPIQKIIQLLDNIFKQHNKRTKNFAIIHIQTNPNNVDFNVSPDKRDIFLKIQDEMLFDLSSFLFSFVEQNNSQIRQVEEPKRKKISYNTQINTSIEPQNSNRSSQNLRTNGSGQKSQKMEEEIQSGDQQIVFEESFVANFEKKMFHELEIKGQFNLGFIITFHPEQNIFYIIDQHASNEKQLYEKYMNELQISYQKCIHPCKLNLTDLDLLIINENQDVFRKNGFFIENGHLVKIPFIQQYQLDENDIQDIIQQIKNGILPQKIRPKKIMQIFATKACRKAVKVGDPLELQKQQQIVSQLADLESPWNCPHGRPTLIKTPNIQELIKKIELKPVKRKIKYQV